MGQRAARRGFWSGWALAFMLGTSFGEKLGIMAMGRVGQMRSRLRCKRALSKS